MAVKKPVKVARSEGLKTLLATIKARKAAESTEKVLGMVDQMSKQLASLKKEVRVLRKSMATKPADEVAPMTAEQATRLIQLAASAPAALAELRNLRGLPPNPIA